MKGTSLWDVAVKMRHEARLRRGIDCESAGGGERGKARGISFSVGLQSGFCPTAFRIKSNREPCREKFPEIQP
jgi:hypothetical protein